MPRERDATSANDEPATEDKVAGVAKILSFWEDSDLLYTETAEEIVAYCFSAKNIEQVIRDLDRKRHEFL